MKSYPMGETPQTTAPVVRKEEEKGSAKQSKIEVHLFMNFSTILTVGEGRRSHGKEEKKERKEGRGLPPTSVRSPTRI